MWHRVNYKKLAKTFIFLIIFILASKEIYHSLKYSSQLSPTSDPFSEADAIRSGEGFAKNGFLVNLGLPDVVYGNQFPNAGFKEYITKDSLIYTHYPPGPNWLAGLLTKICGVGNLGCFRLFPTMIGILSLILFARMLLSALGPVKSATMMFAIAIIPMTSNMMHGLYYHGYAFSLLLIQLGLLLNTFKKKRLHTFHLCILFFLGFLQGWLSFDYFFLVSLSALPFALLYFQLDQREDKKRVFLAIITPSLGFCFAHLLHFIQVSIYYHSVISAFNDVVIEASKYQISEASHPKFVDVAGGANANFITSRIILLFKYLTVFARKRNFFIIDIPILLGIVFVLISLKDAKLIIYKPLQIVLRWISSKRNFYVILTAFIVSFLWIIIMKDHAVIHTHLLPRHLFLLYFFCILTILECVSAENSNNQES